MQVRSESGKTLYDNPEVSIIEENDDHLILNTGWIIENPIIVEQDDIHGEVVIVNGESFEFINPLEDCDEFKENGDDL